MRNHALFSARNMLELRNPTSIISFTFDDFPRTSYLVGGSILRAYGFKGTYYAALGLMGKESPVGRIFHLSDLENIIHDGSELGCHTYDHIDALKGNSSLFEDSIKRNQAALAQLLPHIHFKSFAYPKNTPRAQSKRLASKFYACSRAGGQSANGKKVDLNMLKSFFIDCKSTVNPSALKRLINRSVIDKRWLILSTHDICEAPSNYGCTPDFFEDIVEHIARSGALVLGVYETYSRFLFRSAGGPLSS